MKFWEIPESKDAICRINGTMSYLGARLLASRQSQTAGVWFYLNPPKYLRKWEMTPSRQVLGTHVFPGTLRLIGFSSGFMAGASVSPS